MMSFRTKEAILRQKAEKADMAVKAFREEVDQRLDDCKEGESLIIFIPSNILEEELEKIIAELKIANWEAYVEPLNNKRMLFIE